MAAQKEYCLTTSAILENRPARVTVEYRGSPGIRDVRQYIFRLEGLTSERFSGFLDVTEQYGWRFPNKEDPPHLWKIQHGWSVIPLVLRRTLRAMLRNKEHWKEWNGDFRRIPDEIRAQITQSTKSEAENQTIDIRRRDTLVAKVSRVISDIHFNGLEITPTGVYLSTQFSMTEVTLALQHLQNLGIIKWPFEEAINEWLKVEVDYAKLEPLRTPPVPLKASFMLTALPYDQAPFTFMMMPFKETFWDWFDGMKDKKSIRKVLESSSGIRCVTVDDDKTPFRIEDKIFTHISQSTLCVANISDVNPSVFYEVGMAHAIGKPVILVCDEEAYARYIGEKSEDNLFGQFLKSVFDVNHITILKCKDKDDLLPKLQKAVDHTLRAIGER